MAIGEPLPLVSGSLSDVEDTAAAVSVGFEILERRLLAIEESLNELQTDLVALDARVVILETP